ncbi:MAG: ABC transporter permease [Dehalococcoidia bacterium]|nr:ABC transporter permease [Dehalococcoidia bacterium]
MTKYIAQRLLLMIPTILLLTLMVFILMRVLPGDVVTLILGDETGGGFTKAGNVSVDVLRKRLGLDQPLPMQYLTWLGDMVRGDFGRSLYSNIPVMDDILLRLPITVQLALMGTIAGMLLGIPMGILSAVYHNSWLDQVLRFLGIVFLAVPSFWLGLVVILTGSIWFNYVPPIGRNVLWESPIDNMLQLMWPTLILASLGMATIARMTRSTMLEVLREDYIRTARAKGLSEQVVIVRHALKNALIPVVTLAGLTFANLMGGTVILEQIFSIPGMGQFFITAILKQDYTIVQSTLVVFAVVFMLVNLLVDLTYGWLDPRISYS